MILPCGHAEVENFLKRKMFSVNVGRPGFLAKLRLAGTSWMLKIVLDGGHTEICLLSDMMERGELVEQSLVCHHQGKNACYGSCAVGAYGVCYSCRDSMTDLWGRSRDRYYWIAEPGVW